VKLFPVAAAAAALALSSVAVAQPAGADKQPSKQTASQTSKHTPPKHWKKSKEAYQSHVKACQAKFRSYDPATDTYKAPSGKTVICQL